MSEYEVDVSDAREDDLGVIFHVKVDGRPKTMRIAFDTLSRWRKSHEQPISWSDYVKSNHDLVRRLVEDGAENGWNGPVTELI